MIENGMTNHEIAKELPQYMFRLRDIDNVRQTMLEERYKGTRRLDIEVTYVYGQTGAGKTRGIMDKYGDEKVYRVTDYTHPFDSYRCQEVIVFDEFRSSLKIQNMLNYLDIYPLELPARYNNKWACYTKVFIVSNIPLEAQYVNVQFENEPTWAAFLGRIKLVKEYKDGEIIVRPADPRNTIPLEKLGEVVAQALPPALQMELPGQ